MSISMLCSQCGSPAERCERCAAALCPRRLCAELHDAACEAMSTLPAQPTGEMIALSQRPTPTPTPTSPRRQRRERDYEAECTAAEQLVVRISQHRQTGRAALLGGDLETAVDELWLARDLEPHLDRLGAAARAVLPRDWEMETDLT